MSEDKPRKVGKSAGNRGKGRKKGVPNKVTSSLKQMMMEALDGVGGQAYLQAQASENPRAFLAMLGRLIPHDVHLSGGEGGQPINLTVNFVKPNKD